MNVGRKWMKKIEEFDATSISKEGVSFMVPIEELRQMASVAEWVTSCLRQSAAEQEQRQKFEAQRVVVDSGPTFDPMKELAHAMNPRRPVSINQAREFIRTVAAAVESEET